MAHAYGPTPRYPRALQLFADADTIIGTRDVWPGAANLYPFFTSTQSLEIVSDDAANSAAGTGARTLGLRLLDANWAPVKQTVTLNGTTPVAVPGGPYWRCLTALVETSGSYGKIENGPVRVRIASGGADCQVLKVDTTEGRASNWTFTPDNYPFGLHGWSAFIADVNKSTIIKFVLQVRNVTQSGSWVTLDPSPELDDTNRFYLSRFSPITTRDPSDVYDMRISMESDTADTAVQVHYQMLFNEPSLNTVDQLLGV